MRLECRGGDLKRLFHSRNRIALINYFTRIVLLVVRILCPLLMVVRTRILRPLLEGLAVERIVIRLAIKSPPFYLEFEQLP